MQRFFRLSRVAGSAEIHRFGIGTALAKYSGPALRALTFLTVLIGTLAVTTGVLGMNFEMAFFGSERGFWITLAAMIVLSAVA